VAHPAPCLHGAAPASGKGRRPFACAGGRRGGPASGRTREILGYDWGSPELAEQLLDAKILLSERAQTHFFAVEIDNEIVAWTDLYVAQGVAQIEDVATVEQHRGKGYATAVVLQAAKEGRKAGADLVFLVADGEDWPQLLYGRLGFDEIGRVYKFLTP
jgi:ribosomal protein S18 acetylase RimI-like enzyme